MDEYIGQAKNETKGLQEVLDRLREKQKRSAREMTGIPVGYREGDGQDAQLVNSKAYMALTELTLKSTPAAVIPKRIVILGPVKSGKTRIACKWLEAGLRRGQFGRYTTLENYLTALRGGDNQEFFDCTNLVIDNANLDGLAPWEKRQFTHLVDERAGKGNHTVIVVDGKESDMATLPQRVAYKVTDTITVKPSKL